MKRKAILLTLVFLLLCIPAAQAMSSTNFALDWMVPLTGGGGGAAESANYAIHYTVGQSVVGRASSPDFRLNLGFWQPFDQARYLWLPIIEK